MGWSLLSPFVLSQTFPVQVACSAFLARTPCNKVTRARHGHCSRTGWAVSVCDSCSETSSPEKGDLFPTSLAQATCPSLWPGAGPIQQGEASGVHAAPLHRPLQPAAALLLQRSPVSPPHRPPAGPALRLASPDAAPCQLSVHQNYINFSRSSKNISCGAFS